MRIMNFDKNGKSDAPDFRDDDRVLFVSTEPNVDIEKTVQKIISNPSKGLKLNYVCPNTRINYIFQL